MRNEYAISQETLGFFFGFFSAIFLVTSIRLKKWILLADSGKMYKCANRFLSQITFYMLTKLQFLFLLGKVVLTLLIQNDNIILLPIIICINETVFCICLWNL